MEKWADGSMGTWCLRHTLILLFSFRFLSSHIHLSPAVTDFIRIADTVMKTDLNLLNTFKRNFVVFLSVDPGRAVWNCSPYVLTWFQSHVSCLFFCVCQVNVAPARKSSESNFLKDGESLSLLQMGADQRGEWRRAEQTCLIKWKRWNDSLMHLLDAQLRSITCDFECEVSQQRVGQEEVLQTQGRSGGCSELDEVPDYSTSSGTGRGFWMPFGSALFMEPHLWNTSFPFFLSLFLFSLLHPGSFSPSALIGGAVKVCGVSASSRWGLLCVSHWCSPSDASTNGCDRACCSSYQISASLTKPTVLNLLSAPQIT